MSSGLVGRHTVFTIQTRLVECVQPTWVAGTWTRCLSPSCVPRTISTSELPCASYSAQRKARISFFHLAIFSTLSILKIKQFDEQFANERRERERNKRLTLDFSVKNGSEKNPRASVVSCSSNTSRNRERRSVSAVPAERQWHARARREYALRGRLRRAVIAVNFSQTSWKSRRMTDNRCEKSLADSPRSCTWKVLHVNAEYLSFDFISFQICAQVAVKKKKKKFCTFVVETHHTTCKSPCIPAAVSYELSYHSICHFFWSAYRRGRGRSTDRGSTGGTKVADESPDEASPRSRASFFLSSFNPSAPSPRPMCVFS